MGWPERSRPSRDSKILEIWPNNQSLRRILEEGLMVINTEVFFLRIPVSGSVFMLFSPTEADRSRPKPTELEKKRDELSLLIIVYS